MLKLTLELLHSPSTIRIQEPCSRFDALHLSAHSSGNVPMGQSSQRLQVRYRGASWHIRQTDVQTDVSLTKHIHSTKASKSTPSQGLYGPCDVLYLAC